MDALTYSMLGGLVLLLVILLLKNEWKKFQRYKRYLDMDVEVQFQESSDPYDHMHRGSVMLHLHKCGDNIKSIVIHNVSFSHSAFHVPSVDKLYFKGKDNKSQLLSASFRIRRHALRRLANKSLYIHLSGRISDEEGKEKLFKARIPYMVKQSVEHNPPIVEEALFS